MLICTQTQLTFLEFASYFFRLIFIFKIEPRIKLYKLDKIVLSVNIDLTFEHEHWTFLLELFFKENFTLNHLIGRIN